MTDKVSVDSLEEGQIGLCVVRVDDRVELTMMMGIGDGEAEEWTVSMTRDKALKLCGDLVDVIGTH